MSQLLFFWSKKVWLQGTIPEENNMLKSLPWYWPKFEFIYLDIQLFHVIVAVLQIQYRIGGVMVGILSLNVIDRGFEPSQVKPKTMKLVFVASPLSMQH